MTTLLSLIGEQPIPNLLVHQHLKPGKDILLYTDRTKPVAERLAKILFDAVPQKLHASEYDLPAMQAELTQLLTPEQDVVVNLTGGTKLMAIAAYTVAQACQFSHVYLRTEGKKSRLYRYADNQSTNEVLPTLLTLEQYLRAFLPDYKLDTQQTSGKAFEDAIAHALEADGLEVLQGIRPAKVGDQIEIDLAFRLGNQVGIAEVKLGDTEGDSIKKGLDQLKMAGGPEYLGTYTVQFLITGRPLKAELNRQMKTLAGTRNVTMIELSEFNKTRENLPKPVAERLCRDIRAKLS